MKRLIALVLTLLMLLPLVSCASTLGEGGSVKTETKEDAAKPSTQKTEEEETDPYAIDQEELVIPEGNTVGFARADVTPEVYPIYISSGMTAEKALDPIYITCVAIADGENVALLISADLKRISDEFLDKCYAAIEETTGVSSEYVFLNATHNHNAPSITSNSVNCIKWQALCIKRLKWACREAIRDLSPATASIGTADTMGFAFVRRYICEDGSLQGIHHAITTGSPVVKHESEADAELQAIRFEREGDKQDIVMVNWQAHVAHAANEIKNAVTADFVKNFRDGVEEKYDVLFAYYNGASGNLNLSTKFPELKAVNGGYREVGKALVEKLGEAMENMEQVQMGKIRALASTVTGVVRKDDPKRVEEAGICMAASGTQQELLLAEYGFQSKYEAQYMVNRASANGNDELPVSAISCGDLAFAANACEMFDTNGMEVKNGSPFKMTFMCAYTNGQFGYIPSNFAFPRGGYEVDVTRYVQGTGELLATELVRLLNELAQ